MTFEPPNSDDFQIGADTEHACADTWRNIRDDLKRIQLAQLLSPHGTVWQVTEPTAEASKRLKLLQIKPPPPVLKLV